MPSSGVVDAKLTGLLAKGDEAGLMSVFGAVESAAGAPEGVVFVKVGVSRSASLASPDGGSAGGWPALLADTGVGAPEGVVGLVGGASGLSALLCSNAGDFGTPGGVPWCDGVEAGGFEGDGPVLLVVSWVAGVVAACACAGGAGGGGGGAFFLSAGSACGLGSGLVTGEIVVMVVSYRLNRIVDNRMHYFTTTPPDHEYLAADIN